MTWLAISAAPNAVGRHAVRRASRMTVPHGISGHLRALVAPAREITLVF